MQRILTFIQFLYWLLIALFNARFAIGSSINQPRCEAKWILINKNMAFHAVTRPSVNSSLYAQELYARENEVIKCDYKQQGGFYAILMPFRFSHNFLSLFAILSTLFLHLCHFLSFAMRFLLLSIIILLCDFNDFLLPWQRVIKIHFVDNWATSSKVCEWSAAAEKSSS